ncbi:hypothetical protein ABMB67_000381 [Halalkalibacter oceani]
MYAYLYRAHPRMLLMLGMSPVRFFRYETYAQVSGKVRMFIVFGPIFLLIVFQLLFH